MNRSNAIDKRVFLLISVVFLLTVLFSATNSYASNPSSDTVAESALVPVRNTNITFIPEEIQVEEPGSPVSEPSMELSYTDMTLLSRTSATEEELNQALAGTGMEGQAGIYLKAQDDYGINASALLAIAIQESGWGRSSFARTRNNYFGFQAYTGNPQAARRFSSPEEGLDTVAAFLQKAYLDESGKYYRGGTLRDINPIYSSDKDWKHSVALIWKNLESGAYKKSA